MPHKIKNNETKMNKYYFIVSLITIGCSHNTIHPNVKISKDLRSQDDKARELSDSNWTSNPANAMIYCATLKCESGTLYYCDSTKDPGECNNMLPLCQGPLPCSDNLNSDLGFWCCQ